MFSISAVNNAAVDPLHGLSRSTDPPWESLVAFALLDSGTGGGFLYPFGYWPLPLEGCVSNSSVM